jgi:hypothetical protein
MNRIARCRSWVLLVVFGTACSPASDKTSFFVTSVQAGDGGNIGGLAPADAHCQKLAEAAGIRGREWRAYLSTAAIDRAPVVNARDRIGNGPWYNTRGELIANSLEDLHRDGDGNHINVRTARSEKGGVVRAHDMLTGSNTDGTLAEGDATCHNWTSTDGHAVLGHHDRNGINAAGGSWNSAHLSDGCSFPLLRQSGGAALFYCSRSDSAPAATSDPVLVSLYLLWGTATVVVAVDALPATSFAVIVMV